MPRPFFLPVLVLGAACGSTRGLGGPRAPTMYARLASIPAGAFVAGSGPDERATAALDVPAGSSIARRIAAERLRSEVYLPAFAIDRTPVTVRDYAYFTRATHHPHPWSGGDPPAERLSHPVTLVTWDDASAYCAWRGARLPTELEWEKAARGTRGSIYPWGDRYDPLCLDGPETGPGDTTPVVSFVQGLSPFGLSDMAGNVRQWTSSPGSSPGRYVLRGSAWSDPPALARAAARDERPRDAREPSLGFRCAADRTP